MSFEIESYLMDPAVPATQFSLPENVKIEKSNAREQDKIKNPPNLLSIPHNPAMPISLLPSKPPCESLVPISNLGDIHGVRLCLALPHNVCSNVSHQHQDSKRVTRAYQRSVRARLQGWQRPWP